MVEVYINQYIHIIVKNSRCYTFVGHVLVMIWRGWGGWGGEVDGGRITNHPLTEYLAKARNISLFSNSPPTRTPRLFPLYPSPLPTFLIPPNCLPCHPPHTHSTLNPSYLSEKVRKAKPGFGRISFLYARTLTQYPQFINTARPLRLL